MSKVDTVMIDLDPNTLSNQERYKLLIGSIVPRPIAFVSTMSPQGVANLAPFSFFTACGSSPMRVCFVPMTRSSDGQKKDTLKNIEATKEFVVHIVSEDMALAMNQTSAEYPPEVSEFEAAGLTPIPSLKVKPPRVKEAKIQMECTLHQLVELGTGIGEGTIVIGNVVALHFDDTVYQEGRIDLTALQPVARLAGSGYARTTDTFELPRPTL